MTMTQYKIVKTEVEVMIAIGKVLPTISTAQIAGLLRKLKAKGVIQ